MVTRLTLLIVILGTLSLGHSLSVNRLNEVIQFEQQQVAKFNGSIWALLVAGSNGYYNYRHQADICHAYHVLRSHGIPESNIIVMMYDDIATNDQNPTPGIIINQPGGKDVYHGVPKDYTGDDVTPETFLQVLQGNQELADSGKKVVRSNNRDHIFVFFSDHGAPGIIAFPTSELSAKDLNKALVKMSKVNAYNKMAIYIEACESGSMFKDLLPEDINIFATTAANDVESSYACYFDDKRGTYLGDLYSVSWMEDSDLHKSLRSETLTQQFRTVKEETNTSHVMEFGDLSMGNLPLSQFQGAKLRDENETSFSTEFVTKRELIQKNVARRMKDAIPSPDVPLISLKRRAEIESDPIKRSKLVQEFNYMSEARQFLARSMVDLAYSLVSHVDTFTSVSHESLISTKQSLTRHDCYDKLRFAFDAHCFDLSTHPYALRFLYILVNVCESVHESDEEHIADTIARHCTQNTLGHPYSSIH